MAVDATTDTGAAVSTEDQFQSVWDAGASGDDRREDAAGDQNAATETGQTGDGGDQQQRGADDNAPTYASLDELLTSLKVDPVSVQSLPVTVKIDGQEKQVPLADVLKSYQLEGHVNNKSINLSNERTAFEQERSVARQLFSQQLQQSQAMGQAALEILNQDFQRIDWNALRATNPAEFVALQHEFQQRQAGIQGYLQQVGAQQQLQQQEMQHLHQQNIAAQQQKLVEAVPEWRDPAAFGKDREQIVQYARGLGFQDAELNLIFDHRYMLVLRDAARYRALQASSPEALKKVRQAPPMAKPGSRVDTSPNEVGFRSAVDRFNRNPRDEDAAAAVFSHFA